MARTRSNWAAARESAWRQFGRKHSNWFVYGHLAKVLAPWLAAVAVLVTVGWAVAWAWHHIPLGTVALLAAVGAVAVLAGWGGYEWMSVTAARKGFSVQRLALFGASGALGVAAVMAAMHR